jgi:rubrerythrin
MSLDSAVLPFTYRNLVLKRGASETNARNSYEALVEKFYKDEDCEVARYTRNIAIKDEIPAKDLLVILDKISKHGTLRKLRFVNPDQLHITH